MKDSITTEQSRAKRRFHRLSIQTKLVFIILASAVILIGVGFSAIVYWEIKMLNRQAVEETEFAVALISQDLSRLLLVGSVDSAADTVTGLKSFERINSAVLFDLQNQPVFYYSRDHSVDFDPALIRPGEVPAGQGRGFDLFVPVRYRNDQYGQIYLNVSSDVYRARLMGYIKVIALILPLMVMLSVFIAIKFQKYFSGPILQLVQVIKRVSSTHDYSQKLVFDETNEIGELYRGFNLLMEQVDFNTQRLQAVRDELENSNLELNKLNNVLQDHKFAIDQAAKVSITNPDGVITYVNEQFCAMSKYSKDELLGKTYAVVKSGFHTREFFTDLWSTVARGEVWKGEIQNRAKDGSYYWVNTTIVPFLNEEGRPTQFFAIHFDITSRKEAERSLRAARDVAESAVASQAGFIKTLSDEVRLPMQTILMAGPESVEAQRQADRLLTLFNNALDYSRLISGQLELDHIPFDLRHTIGQISSAGEGSSDDQIMWFAMTRANVPEHLVGDPGRLREIVQSFIELVLGFVRYGTLALEILPLEFMPGRVMLRFNLHADALELSGDLIRKIRNTFASLKQDHQHTLPGWRISAALSALLIQRMGGEMGIEAIPGRGGSLFWFTLDLEVPATPLIEAKAVPEQLPTPAPYRLLYVGQDHVFFDFLCAEASRNHGRADLCPGPAKVEDFLIDAVDRGQPFHLVLFDLDNASEKVLDLGRQLRSNPLYRSLRLVKLDTVAHRGDARLAERAGFTGYLARPLPLAEIGRFLNHLRSITPATQETIATRFIYHEQGSPTRRRALVIHRDTTARVLAARALTRLGMAVDVAARPHETEQLQVNQHYCIVLLEISRGEGEEDMSGSIAALRSRFAHGQPMPVLGLVTADPLVEQFPESIPTNGCEEAIAWPTTPEQLTRLVNKWTT